MGLTVEFGSFESNGKKYPYRATVSVEVSWLGWNRNQVADFAARGAQDEASRFCEDGQCLTQQLEREKRTSESRLEWAERAEEKAHRAELKVRRLQREVKALKPKDEEGGGDEAGTAAP